MFNNYVSHTCMIEHSYEHVYGEQPYMSKSKPLRGFLRMLL